MEWVSLLLLIGFAVGVFFGGQWIGERLFGGGKPGSAYTKEQMAEFEERNRRFKQEFEARNPDGPPISDAEYAEFASWLSAQTKPAVQLEPDADIPAQPDGSRLGGPVWLAEGQLWPVSRLGEPMEFLAQLDFADFSGMDAFPDSGVVQFFISQDDDLWGMNMDDPASGDVAVIYRPGGAGTQHYPQVPALPQGESITPFLSETTRSGGVSLKPTAFTDVIDASNWLVDTRLDGQVRRPGFDRWEDLVEANQSGRPYRHQSGGFPCFVQSDFREAGKLDDYDTALLCLTSDDHLQWGDVGEANFMIRATDLAVRDFAKVIFWWDCS